MATATRTTRKKTTGRPAAAAARPAPLVDLDEDPFDETAVGRRLLFERDGVDYYIPDAVSARTLQEFVRREADDGISLAMWWLFEELAGPDAVAALRGYRGLTGSHLRQLRTACIDVLTGPKA